MCEILLLCIWLSNCYRQVLTCACNVAFAGSRGGLAVLQTYQVLCALLLNQMLGRNGILVMGKCLWKLWLFFFHVGGAGTGGQEPGGVQYTWRVWQVALQKGVAIVAVSGPGNSLSITN